MARDVDGRVACVARADAATAAGPASTPGSGWTSSRDNLDGGGSTTLIHHGHLLNRPYSTVDQPAPESVPW